MTQQTFLCKTKNWLYSVELLQKGGPTSKNWLREHKVGGGPQNVSTVTNYIHAQNAVPQQRRRYRSLKWLHDLKSSLRPRRSSQTTNFLQARNGGRRRRRIIARETRIHNHIVPNNHEEVSRSQCERTTKK